MDLGFLFVVDVLYRLLFLEGGFGFFFCLFGGKYIVLWGYEDMLFVLDSNIGFSFENKDVDLGCCFMVDGFYLYIINLVGRGVSKLGFGLYGIFRGFVYCWNEELELGWVVFGSGSFFYWFVFFDNKFYFFF